MAEKYVNSNTIGGECLTRGCYEDGDMVAAQMPVKRQPAEYNMKHKNRGLALIFNHEVFDDGKLDPRSGTNKDCECLSVSLKKLHFDVKIHQDKKLKEIKTIIDEVSRLDHTDNDCILVAILSHGEFGFIHARDEIYKLDSIAYHFTDQYCQSLAGKPKLFFIQACQGERCDPGITLETDGESSSIFRIPVPIHPDFLVACSTIPEFLSWRDPRKGSWFIQSLCEELNENGKTYDILTLLTFVCQRVALNFVSNTFEIKSSYKKQITCTTTMLTKILRFPDKN